MGNWMGWNFGYKGTHGGAANVSQGKEVDVQVEIIGTVGSVSDLKGNDKAVHRAEIVVRGKDGKEITRASTLGTLGQLLDQADGIRNAGDKAVGRAKRAKRGHLFGNEAEWGEGQGHGGGDYEGQGPEGGR